MKNSLISETRDDCRFCTISNKISRRPFDHVISESKNYFAIASLGGFVNGWTLICTKDHRLNLREDYRSPEFKDFTQRVADTVGKVFGKSVFFEHGANLAGSATGCGTEHAHLHVVPYSHDFVEDTQRFDLTKSWSKSLLNVDEGEEYLLMANDLTSLFAQPTWHAVNFAESQFFRRALAHHTAQVQCYDYRASPGEANAQATAEILSSQMALTVEVQG
ncbi:HIT family protein [Schauerella aestuarii]|uniref:HIT family protein n=1 Tax=Schauerella aestuarii TaxID=2511204 RepID=UPI001369F27C|nr:hypothetical protein [Achromobacter aestuarii]MYZ45187.1 hypothetical protein [Achromobacter aestuarii]